MRRARKQLRDWRWRVRIDAPFKYGMTILFVGAATFIRHLLQPVLAGRSVFILFTLAVMASATVGGRRAGLLAILLSSIVATLFFIQPDIRWQVIYLNHAMQTLLFIVVGAGISFLADELNRAKLIAEQRAEEAAAALERVRVLSGLLPICASCKKIRNAAGSWEQIESYIRSRSEVEFTHSLCPKCAEEFESAI